MQKEANLKGDKQLKKNYGPVSLLLICSKIFVKVIFTSLFKHLDDNSNYVDNDNGN